MEGTQVPEENDHSFTHVVGSWRKWWNTAVIGTVNKSEVIAKRREECEISARYLFMLSMSAAIAVLGLLLSSPAVVIGAMLLSPLMEPIIGLGFALATGDYNWMRKAAKSLLVGTLMAVLGTALIVFLSPLQTVTAEIAARTRPNLFDLGVAFFSALAGAYAMIRGREGTVVGVAIATALMPPLAVVGFGLATANWTVFFGALFLYVTNLLTIALTAWLMAKLYGFRSTLSERQTVLQSVAVVVVFVTLAVPLFLSLNQIVWETRSEQKINREIEKIFGDRSVVSDLDIVWDKSPITISATVFTPDLKPEGEGMAARAITLEIERPVQVTLNQSLVGEDEDAAQAAQLAAARASQEAADLQRREALASRLALMAGVDVNEVTVDRERRRALVAAKPIEGATLAAYRELENRIAATEPEWTIRFVPPARPLPAVSLEDGVPNASGNLAIGLIAWAADRIGVPVVLTGTEAETAAVASLLRQQGTRTISEISARNAGRVLVRWGAPSE